MTEISDIASNFSMKPASFSALRDTQLTRRSAMMVTLKSSHIEYEDLLHIFALTDTRSVAMSC